MGLTQITTGGVDENINIDSNTLKVDGTNNRVGIGTASPATALHVSGSGTQRIRITGTGSANAILTLDAPSGFANYIEYGASASTPLAFYDVANTAERMRIDSQGRVGIGTSSPDQMLHLSNNSGPVLRFENTDTTIASGNSFGAIEFESRDSSSSAGVVAKIEGFAPNTMDGTATNGGALRFSTATVNPVSLSERMRIDSSGNTTFKYADSSTSTSTQVPPGLRINNTDNTSGRLAGIHFSHGGAGTANAGIFHVTTNTATGSTTCLGDLAFYMKASGSSTMTERMRIDSSGRVGIGTTATQQILTIDVNDSGTAPGSFNGINIANTNTTANNGSAITFGQTVPGNSNARIGVIQTARGPSESQEMFFGLLGSGSYSEVMRLDSSGRLLVGTSSARSNLNGTGVFQVETATATADNGVTIINNGSFTPRFRLGLSKGTTIGSNTSVASGDGLGTIQFVGNDGTNFVLAATINGEVDGTPGSNDMPGRLVFSTTADGASSPTERMRIDKDGMLTVLTGDYGVSAETTQGAGTSYFNFRGRYGSDGSPGSGVQSFLVWSNGNVQNTNNSYTAISDVKLKENIVDANPQWDDIKALRVRNYNLKEGQTHTQIGVVAQEVEPISPGLVYESPDFDDEGNDLGTTTKSVNYSVLYMKAVKALQEAMDRIETLETKVAALEAAE